MNEIIKPIEEIDPCFADLILDIVHKKYNYGIKELYISNNIIQFKKLDNPCGRNDLCPCGSGKKFKKCFCIKYHPYWID